MGKKVVFCGGGKMSESMLRNMLNRKVVVPEDITVNELIPVRCDYLKDTYGVNAVGKLTDEVAAADMIIIAVKPNQAASVLETIKPTLGENTIVFSIAAGVSLEAMADQIGTNHKIARVIPNTLGESGKGYSAYCLNNACEEADKAFVEEILASLGKVKYLPEDSFNLFQSFASVGPLWLYKTIEALTDAGVYIGIGRDDARDFILQNMLGVAGVLELTGEHPAVKVDQMTSPGGITIEALKVLEDDGFAASLINSVVACNAKMNCSCNF